MKTAHEVLAEKRKRNPKINYYGHADFIASAVLAATSTAPSGDKISLKIVQDDKGFPGHTTIEGWPVDDSLCDWIATTIASCCTLRLTPG